MFRGLPLDGVGHEASLGARLSPIDAKPRSVTARPAAIKDDVSATTGNPLTTPLHSRAGNTTIVIIATS